MNENFWYQTFFEAQKGFLTKFFGNLRQKIFVKTVMLPPMTRRNLSIPEVFWNTEGFHHIFFRQSEIKNFHQISDAPPPFLSMKFFDTRRFLKHRRVALRIFFFLWEKEYSTQIRDTPLLGMSFFDIPNFFDTLKGSPQNDSAIWDKIFSPENLDTLPLIYKFFSIPENFWYTEVFSNKVFRFGCLRRKIFDKTVMPPPPPFPWIKIFGTRFFLKHRRVPQRILSALWDKKSGTKSRDTPTPSIESIEISGGIDVCRKPWKIRF